ncbi:sensor histidine kinase [Rhodoferax mekongensis]|uniref:histidine kinase n=1 Tax=Rhodoferax mekongensis TaxID=3068341 RepID=A0ABZ0B1F8_9BURK|nr:ATP-binding protein [Rhodoferax sp. TBRC 17307]WNO05283.1 ATP-binding protein [Rhodoferax sp. TBRC 17307]
MRRNGGFRWQTNRFVVLGHVFLALFVLAVAVSVSLTLYQDRQTLLALQVQRAKANALVFEDQISQTFQAIENTVRSIPEFTPSDLEGKASSDVQALLKRLQHGQPALRSLSLMQGGVVVQSTHPGNVGVSPEGLNLVPDERPDATTARLRVGRNWIGRDFHQGHGAQGLASDRNDRPYLLPLSLRLTQGARPVSVLVGVNPDYFLGRQQRFSDSQTDRFQLVRIDGAVLLDTADAAIGAAFPYPDIVERARKDEIGVEQSAHILSFRSSAKYPFFVAVHVDQERILESWRHKAMVVGGVTGCVLLLVAASASALLRRIHHAEIAHRQERELAHATMERDLEARIAQRTQELTESKRSLEHTLSHLRDTQSQLIQSEKLATLGQIVANVAHEINTPIGAVKSSGESISVALNQVLAGFPALVLSLDEATRNLFFALVTEVRKPAEPLSTREERALNRAVRAELEAADMPDAQTKADWLLGLKVRQQPMRFAALLQHPRAGDFFEMANQIATIIHSADNINLAVERVAKIIFALKSFSHTDASGEFQPVDLKAGMETVLTIYSNQIKQGVEVTREYGNLGLVECLPDELNQVWTNLIHNALQAMNNQGKLLIAMQAQDHGVRVSITDNGPGISPDIQTRIFDPFFTTKPVGEGSGLGLDIARKIVDKHHGRLELHSEVGVGTTFSVWLPLQQAT